MTNEELLNRVTINPEICGGFPCIRGTRIYEDIRAAIAYAAELATEI